MGLHGKWHRYSTWDVTNQKSNQDKNQDQIHRKILEQRYSFRFFLIFRRSPRNVEKNYGFWVADHVFGKVVSSANIYVWLSVDTWEPASLWATTTALISWSSKLVAFNFLYANGQPSLVQTSLKTCCMRTEGILENRMNIRNTEQWATSVKSWLMQS